MSEKQFLPKLLRDEGHRPSNSLIKRLESGHAKRFNRLMRSVAPIQGAAQLLNLLKRRWIEFAIATSGGTSQTKALLARIVTADDATRHSVLIRRDLARQSLFSLRDKQPQICSLSSLRCGLCRLRLLLGNAMAGSL